MNRHLGSFSEAEIESVTEKIVMSKHSSDN